MFQILKTTTKGLDVLKVKFSCFAKKYKRTIRFAVFDNGGCEEVVEWLVKLKNENIIQWLYLSSENMKKLGAWNVLFSASQGDYVVISILIYITVRIG